MAAKCPTKALQLRLLALAVAALVGAVRANYVSQLEQKSHASGGYITAIEDHTTEPGGLFVATSDNNYAIYSPELASRNWIAISVNGNDVFIILKDNSTIVTSLSRLSEDARDFLSETKSNFTQNLIELNLVYSSGYNSASGAGKSHYGAETYKLRSESGAGRAIDKFAAAHSQSTARYASGVGYYSPQPATGYAAQRAPLRLRLPYEPPQRAPFSRYNQQLYPVNNNQQASCVAPNNFNYYNLNKAPELKESLSGDVYHFDMLGNVLDVYSSSVSVKQRCQSVSLVYRDFRCFSYANRGLPLQLAR